MPENEKGKSKPETKSLDRCSRILKLLSLACLGVVLLVRSSAAATLTYRCDDGSTLVVSLLASDHARVARGDAQWTLPHVPSGSGAKYESGGILFWSKGEEATFEREGKSTSCRVAGKESGQMSAQETVTLATIAGTEWVLREWGRDESAPAKPEVTLLVTKGRFTGHSGCNRYFASVKEEREAGQITVGPVGGTRMACPEPVMAVEARFLEQLSRVKRFGFLGMRLALSYEQDGAWNTMVFEKREGQPASER
jgi:heat shock protein HslJ